MPGTLLALQRIAGSLGMRPDMICAHAPMRRGAWAPTRTVPAQATQRFTECCCIQTHSDAEEQEGLRGRGA